MDTSEFERLLREYVEAANGDSNDEEIDAGWACIREAAGLLGVPIPTGSSL